jgi:hypothetical protein
MSHRAIPRDTQSSSEEEDKSVVIRTSARRVIKKSLPSRNFPATPVARNTLTVNTSVENSDVKGDTSIENSSPNSNVGQVGGVSSIRGTPAIIENFLRSLAVANNVNTNESPIIRNQQEEEVKGLTTKRPTKYIPLRKGQLTDPNLDEEVKASTRKPGLLTKAREKVKSLPLSEVFYEANTFPDFVDMSIPESGGFKCRESACTLGSKVEEETFCGIVINNFPAVIFNEIIEMLTSKEVVRLSITSKNFQNKLKNSKLNLSDTPLTTSQIVRHFPFPSKYIITGLYIASKSDDNFIKNTSSLNNFFPTLQNLIIDARYGKRIDANLTDFIIKCSKLTSLIVMGNLGITDIKGLEIVRNLKELRIEYYKGENLKGLETLFNLEVLDLRHCFDLVATDEISNLTKLRDVRFSGNGITSLPNLENCSSLKRLIIDDSTLENIDGLINKSLEFIKLYKCGDLISISNLEKCPLLQKLEIEHSCSIETLDLKNCSNLKFLKLRHVLIKTGSLVGCVSLEEVHLLRLAQIEDLQLLENVTTLKRLKIKSCKKLKWLTGLGRCSELEELYVRNCFSLVRITALSRCLKLKNLAFLNCLSLNELGTLNNCPLLEIVELKVSKSFNDLSFLTNCSNLIKLKAESSSVSSIYFLENHSHLVSLELSELQIKSLAVLTTCPNLLNLNIHKCKQITSLDGLQYCTKLKILQASSCYNLSNINALNCNLSLIEVDLQNCNKLENVASLASCKNLITLDLRGTNAKNVHLLLGHSSLLNFKVGGKVCREDKFIFNFDEESTEDSDRETEF